MSLLVAIDPSTFSGSGAFRSKLIAALTRVKATRPVLAWRTKTAIELVKISSSAASRDGSVSTKRGVG